MSTAVACGGSGHRAGAIDSGSEAGATPSSSVPPSMSGANTPDTDSGAGADSGSTFDASASEDSLHSASDAQSAANSAGDAPQDSSMPDGDSPAPDAGASCMRGQVQPSEVVMLGDSYMDLGNVGPTIQMVAGAMYRTYYLLGAALNYGSGQLNIPYQFDSMAIPDNPDIKVVITTGGGNDILIDNRQCLTTPVQGDTQCHTAIDDSLMKAQELLVDMANHGVKNIVYFFYPHVDPSATFTGPNANDWLDYAYPLAAQMCCGTGAQAPSSPDLTCHGTVAGVDCVFIDTRPEFAGHNDPMDQNSYWFQDGIHPTQPGADAIANKVWAQMKTYCIAQ
jgi:hypothetical protein